MANEHIDVDLRQKNNFGLSQAVQILAGLCALAGVYVTLTNNDTRMQAEIAQIRLDVERIEGSQKDVKNEIKSDLNTITYELRELRSELLKRSSR